jgi:tetratricopeptide (TPR) repeat protein
MCLFDRQGIPEALLTGQYGEEVTAVGDPLQPRLNWWEKLRRRWLRFRWRKRAVDKAASITASTKEKQASFDDDWRVLTNFALIKTNIDGRHFNMHRLVQHTTKRWLEINGELKAWMNKYILVIRSYFAKPDYDNWKVCDYLFPHAQQTAYCRPSDSALLLTWALLLQDISRFVYITGNYTAAETLSRTALSALEDVQGPHSEDTLRSIHQLGLVVSTLKRPREAEALFRRAHEGHLAVLSSDHLDTLDSAKMLSSALNAQKRYEEGEAMQMRVLQGCERVYGSTNIKTQSLMSGLALSCITNGRFEQAEAMHRRVCETDGAYQNMRALAVLLNMQGKSEEAEGIHRQVVEAKMRTAGLCHYETICSINCLSEALVKQGKTDEAGTLYRQILDAYSDFDEKMREEVLLGINALAELLLCQNQLGEAETVGRWLVAESEMLLGLEKFDALVAVHTHADILPRQERFEEALTLYERAYVGTEKCCGADHPDTKEFLNYYNRAKDNCSQTKNILLAWPVDDDSSLELESGGEAEFDHKVPIKTAIQSPTAILV